jgi:hypothetical protein
MLLCLVKYFALKFDFLPWLEWLVMVAAGIADRTGMGHEGKLLSGHAQQVCKWGPGRPTDR